jgi:hypothetical protein
MVPVLTHPSALVAVTVYVVVVAGVATTLAPDVADKPVAGLQLYVAAPEAVNVVDCPAHIT